MFDIFEELMARQTALALATLSPSGPNVRVVNFYYDPQARTLYFASFSDNPKVSEMTANPQVAFTTLPIDGVAHVRGRGIARQSSRSLQELSGCFEERIPGYIGADPTFQESMTLFEIPLERVTVIKSPEESAEIDVNSKCL